MQDCALEPYPAQEEALLELYAGRHLVLSTPTGSGKSLVATGLHFRALCEGRRSFYTSPVKALASEKFFALCEDFGAVNVGMLTGDTSINPRAPIVCCTAEVLANMVLRHGEAANAPFVVMDEFHYYADRERGWAWQVPLIELPRTQFLLMSATLGDTRAIAHALQERTGREVAQVGGLARPVPLEWAYSDRSLHETVERLVANDRAPVYVVSFTQRECHERAQALTSAAIATREHKERIAAAIAGTRFDSSYGRDVKRFLAHGIGIHHAGLLPKYRLLIERLAQKNLLRIISGTDTLGVGINVPIRTVLFSQLCKYDGEKTALLSVRDFRQIAGRAGRKGFDEVGYVVAQAPEHVIENQRNAAKAAASGRKAPPKKQPPKDGFVGWTKETFERLVERPAEPLQSRFELNHGMLIQLLQRAAGGDGPAGGAPIVDRGGYGPILDLVARCHDSEPVKRRHLRRAAQLMRGLRRSGIVEVRREPERGARLRVQAGLQRDFSLHRSLSLYLVEALGALDPEHPDHALDVISLVEAILEHPRAILIAQEREAKSARLAELKAAGVPYEERIRELEEISHPKPKADFIYATFRVFCEHHPWVGEELIRPKSIAREMLETWASFHDTVKRWGIARSEGLLLRYLGDVHATLARTVPEESRTDALEDALAFFRTLLERVDASLVEEWESRARFEPPDDGLTEEAPAAKPYDLVDHPRALAARIRAELHALVHALSRGDFEEAVACVRHDPGDPWDEARFERELAPFLAEHARIVFDPSARTPQRTRVTKRSPRLFEVMQTLVDPEGENDWCVEGEIEVPVGHPPDGPLLHVRRIGI